MANLTITQRLSIVFTLLFGLLAAITGTAAVRLHSSSERTRTLINEQLMKERLVSDWYAVISASVERRGVIARSADRTLVELFKYENMSSSERSSKLQEAIQKLLSSDREREVFTHLTQLRKTWFNLESQILKQKEAGRHAIAMDIFDGQLGSAAQNYLDSVLTLQELHRNEIDRLVAELRTDNEATVDLLVGLFLLATLVAAAATWVIASISLVPLARQ